MGIDLGFTEASRRESEYALCRPHLKKVIGFYAEPPPQGEADVWAAARSTDYILDAARLRQERPELYERLQQSRWHPESQEQWYFNRAWIGEAYDDKSLRRQLREYVEAKPTPDVSMPRLSAEQRAEALRSIPEGDLINAWDRMAYEGHRTICEQCPVRPLNDWSCYLRFSSYPGMDAFRTGFVLTAAYAESITLERLREALFSFPHLDHQKGELPRDKLSQLSDEMGDVQINKSAEVFANLVFEAVARGAKDGETVEGNAVDLEYIPFVDEFSSKFLYRDETYDRDEARHLLPYFETLREVADWAIWEADDSVQRRPLIIFRDRMSTLIEGLKIADKYDLEMYVSY